MLDVWNPYVTDAEKDLANGPLSGLLEYCGPND
jgi:hypothetical protein